MKASILTLLLTFSAVTLAPAQGLVNFNNNSTTLISVGWPSPTLPSIPETYYFGLLTAPVGTLDVNSFQFSGVYATNSNVAGRLFGGVQAVPGWMAGTQRSFLVAGWSANFGHNYNPAWLSGYMGGPPWFPDAFGISSIGTGTAGGQGAEGQVFPTLMIFGGAPSISAGFNMALIPEPSVMGLGLLALLCTCARGRRQQ